MARALLGKFDGDEITVDALKGQINYEIVSVAFNGNGNGNLSDLFLKAKRPTGTARGGVFFYF